MTEHSSEIGRHAEAFVRALAEDLTREDLAGFNLQDGLPRNEVSDNLADNFKEAYGYAGTLIDVRRLPLVVNDLDGLFSLVVSVSAEVDDGEFSMRVSAIVMQSGWGFELLTPELAIFECPFGTEPGAGRGLWNTAILLILESLEDFIDCEIDPGEWF